MEEDYETIQKRFEQFRQLLISDAFPNKQLEEEIINISKKHRFNTEHVVPQSWFKAKEPMKGDLHHLFVCEPKCNNARSNFPYFDYQLNVGKFDTNITKNECGFYETGRFEPEYGKGIVARAMLYFLLRYPGKINKKFQRNINITLLKQWHEQFPVNEYERHRNKAIFEIQGNRNPFIDIPELAQWINFEIG